MRYGFWFDHFGWVIVIVLVVFGCISFLAFQGADRGGYSPAFPHSHEHTHEELG
jgi:hypothetical protein